MSFRPCCWTSWCCRNQALNPRSRWTLCPAVFSGLPAPGEWRPADHWCCPGGDTWWWISPACPWIVPSPPQGPGSAPCSCQIGVVPLRLPQWPYPRSPHPPVRIQSKNLYSHNKERRYPFWQWNCYVYKAMPNSRRSFLSAGQWNAGYAGNRTRVSHSKNPACAIWHAWKAELISWRRWGNGVWCISQR